MRLKLSILVAPLAPRGPANSLIPGPTSKRPQEAVQKFIHFTDGETTIGSLWLQIEEAYKSKYLTQSAYGDFGIKKIQDGNNNDLDISYTVAELFEGEPGEKLIRVVQNYIDRECSIPVTSTLRPARISMVKRPLPPVPAFDSNKRRKTQHDAVLSPYNDVHPDRPINSRERSVPAHSEVDEDDQAPNRAGGPDGHSYQARAHVQGRVISDSEDEREHERQRERECARANNLQSAVDAAQESPRRRTSPRNSLANEVSSWQEDQKYSEDEDPSEDERSGGISEDGYHSSPELEDRQDELDIVQSLFNVPDLPVPRAHSPAQLSESLSISIKQSQSPQLLRNELLPETTTDRHPTPKARSIGNRLNDVYDGPFHTDDERAAPMDGHSTYPTNGKLSQNTPPMPQQKAIAQQSKLHKNIITPNNLRNKAMGSASRSARTVVSHVDSPVHKVVDSQMSTTRPASITLRKASRAAAQAMDDYQEVVVHLSASKSSTRAAHNQKVPNHEFPTYVHGSTEAAALNDEDNSAGDIVQSPQLLSASAKIAKQLTQRIDKNSPDNRTSINRTQRSISGVEQSIEIPAAGRRVGSREPYRNNEEFPPTHDNNLEEIATQDRLEPSSLPKLPSTVMPTLRTVRSPLNTTPSPSKRYLDNQGNDHSSPVNRAKSLSSGAIDEAKARAAEEYENEQTREYFRIEDERKRTRQLRGTKARKATTLKTSEPESTRITRASQAKANSTVQGMQAERASEAHERSTQNQLAQLRERNRALKEKDLEQRKHPHATPQANGLSKAGTSSQPSGLRTDSSRDNARSSRELPTAVRNLTPMYKANERDTDTPMENGVVEENFDVLPTRSGVSNSRREVSASSPLRQPGTNGATAKTHDLGEPVVIISPVPEVRKALHFDERPKKQFQANGVTPRPISDVTSRVNNFTPLNQSVNIKSPNNAHRTEMTTAKRTSSDHSSGADDYRAEAGPSKPSEVFKKFLPEVPVAPGKRTRQTKKPAESNGKKDTTAAAKGKIQSLLNIAVATTSQPKNGKGKALLKKSTVLPEKRQNEVVEVSDEDMVIDLEAPEHNPKKLEKQSTQTAKKNMHTEDSPSQAARSPSNVPLMINKPPSPTKRTSEDTPENLGPRPEDTDRAPAQYIPSSPSESPVEDEMESDSSDASSEASSVAPPSLYAASAESKSPSDNASQANDDDSPVTTPSKSQSSLNADLDAALQQHTERSAGFSSSLARDQPDTQTSLMSQRTTTPPLAVRDDSPEWATPKHLQAGKDMTKYNSATTKDRSAHHVAGKSTPAAVDKSTIDDMSESSEEPSSVSSDSSGDEGVGLDSPRLNTKTTSTIKVKTPQKSQQDSAGLRGQNKEFSQPSRALKEHHSPQNPASSTKMSNSYIVTSQKSTPNHPKSSPPHSSLKPQASKLKPPKSATKPTPSAPALSSSSSSSSEDDSDDDNGSSHASDSDSDMDRQIAAQVASLPEGRTRDTAIKKLRRIAKYTRKLDRNPQKEQRKMGQSGMYEGIGGRARFEELARKWG